MTGASLRAAAVAMAVTAVASGSEQIVADPERRFLAPDEDIPPPRQLSSDVNRPSYHPCYARVGVRINGEERRDITEYDQDAGTAKTTMRQTLTGEIVPYWRRDESRQERRARERWERKHPRPR